MMKGFCQASNLRALIADRQLPGPLSKLYGVLDNLVRGLYRGSMDVQIEDPARGPQWLATPDDYPTPLARDEVQLLKTGLPRVPIKDVQDLSSVFHRGFKYTPCQKAKDSNIKFTDVGGNVAYGRITRLLVTERIQEPQHSGAIYAIVQRYPPLGTQDEEKNPYTYWKHSPCVLKQAECSPELELIAYTQIQGHLAVTPFKDTNKVFSRPCVVLTSLDRVSGLRIPLGKY